MSKISDGDALAADPQSTTKDLPAAHQVYICMWCALCMCVCVCLFMCPQSTMCPPPTYMCSNTATNVSSYCYIYVQRKDMSVPI
jgi:hypothetical protein